MEMGVRIGVGLGNGSWKRTNNTFGEIPKSFQRKRGFLTFHIFEGGIPMNSIVNLQAEAIFQMAKARKSGIKRTYSGKQLIIVYRNGVVTINDFSGSLTIQFELNGRICSVRI